MKFFSLLAASALFSTVAALSVQRNTPSTDYPRCVRHCLQIAGNGHECAGVQNPGVQCICSSRDGKNVFNQCLGDKCWDGPDKEIAAEVYRQCDAVPDGASSGGGDGGGDSSECPVRRASQAGASSQ